MAVYTPEQRQQAVALYQQVGTAETSRQTGIPTRTILTWASEAGAVAHAGREKTAEARAASAERVVADWADYRSREAAAAGATANRLRRELVERMEAGAAGRDVQAMAIAYGIMVDKAELLSGNATSRIETWATSELDRDLRSLIAEMEDQIREGG